MGFYLINTDWDARKDVATYDLWFQHGKAFAGDYEGDEGEHAVLFYKHLKPLDSLFMYHSRVGYVGVGIVKEEWDGVSYQDTDRLLYRDQPYEYRLAVDWILDWRQSPKRGGQDLPMPRGRPWQSIDAAKYPAVHIYAAGCMVTELQEHEEEFRKAVAASAADSDEERRCRLAAANKIPPQITVVTTAYRRNSDVVVEVLKRARGICEGCRKPAPFTRRSDGTPYLEVHHVKTLADGGEDTIENATALCPNCHRKAHLGC